LSLKQWYYFLFTPPLFPPITSFKSPFFRPSNLPLNIHSFPPLAALFSTFFQRSRVMDPVAVFSRHHLLYLFIVEGDFSARCDLCMIELPLTTEIPCLKKLSPYGRSPFRRCCCGDSRPCPYDRDCLCWVPGFFPEGSSCPLGTFPLFP